MTGVDTCERCGFDHRQWNEHDATKTLGLTDQFVDEWTADLRSELITKVDRRTLDARKAIEASDDLVDRVHHLSHLLTSIADTRRLAGDAIPTATGTVAQVSVSDGGVPKTSVGHADVGVRGLAGDTQAARVHHGRPWQAVCLWSQEVIDGFADDGHPIAAGSCGENITVSSVDWNRFIGGTIIDIGPDLRLQLSLPAVPCSKNAQFFTNGSISLMDHDLHPGSSRWYASVLRPGTVCAGDSVTVSPV